MEMEENRKSFDIDPQEVLIRAITHLEDGWIKGQWHSPKGVCLLGALESGIVDLLSEQFVSRVPAPEGTPELVYMKAVREALECLPQQKELVHTFEKALNNRLRAFHGQEIPNVPGYNDAWNRQKSEVIQLMKDVLEDVVMIAVEAETADEAVHVEAPVLALKVVL
jgi:hypothetical protein